MSDCYFCQVLRDYKRIGHILAEKDIQAGWKPVRFEYTVALVQHMYVGEEKKSRNRSVDFFEKGHGFRLKYCPECGRKLLK